MACDQELARRVRELWQGQTDGRERKMFGGTGFLGDGNMAGGVLRRELIVRGGRKEYARARRRPHVRPFDLSGRPMPAG